MAGLAVALGSAQLGLRTALIGPRASVHSPAADAPFDARIYAIALASVALLEQLKVWPAVDATRVQPVSKMRVFGDAGNELSFDAYQASLPRLANIVEESELLRALGAAAGFAPGLARIEAPFDTLQQHADVTRLQLADGSAVEARLVVAADGCGGDGPAEPVPDVLDEAIEDALRQGAHVDVAEDPEVRRQVDGLACLLRFRVG